MKIQVHVFSYNRGPLLENCVQSVRRMAPHWPITIHDDGSDDPETRRVLEKLDVVSHDREATEMRHGGLYANMQRALEEADSEIVVFMQDDNQIVRQLDEEDHRYIAEYFDSCSDAAFLNPAFLRGHRRSSINRHIRILPGFPGYYHEIGETLKRRPVTMYYTDVVIAHVGRLRKAGWAFLTGETANAEQARRLFPRMVHMAHPFLMNVPEVPVYRGSKKTLGVRMAERISGRNPKAYRPMSTEDVGRLRKRDLSEYPFAEDFLTPFVAGIRRPFVFNSVNIRWYTRLLNKLELMVGR